MLKHRPIVYLALVAALGGLLLAGASSGRVLFIGFVGFMLMMHMGGHGHGAHGQGSHEEHGTSAEPDRRVHAASAAEEAHVAVNDRSTNRND